MLYLGPRTLLLLLLGFPFSCLSPAGKATLLVKAQEAQNDATDDAEVAYDSTVEDEEDEEGVVEEEPIADSVIGKKISNIMQNPPPQKKTSAFTRIVCVCGADFPANEIVRFLVGFTNKGSEEFLVKSLDASFRYPQDFQFYIQNFTALPLNTLVPPEKQASFEYSFILAEQMAGRPFGLVINLHYKDSNGNVFQNSVFNQTVMIREADEGLDGETVFMYVFLFAVVVLMLFGLYQVLETRTRRRAVQKMETGTASHGDVDLSWLPRETLNMINKVSPKPSPRKRTKRTAGVDQ
uniref:Translocon-associated protein subunit alpha n=1 Tax=Latimeria chalumnae TaxID=7897 RepID=H3BGU6_LATCH